MKELHIITPVKDSIDTTVETIDSIMASQLNWPFSYTIYNDYSTAENTVRLAELSQDKGFTLVNLSDVTDHPSPNYRLVLIDAQRKALAAEAGLLVVESDVIVRPDTLQRLADGAQERDNCGIAAAVTVDDDGEINYPYQQAKGRANQVIDSHKHLSFCCSLLTPQLLRAMDFNELDERKNWYDVTISHKSCELGFSNYLFTTLPVTHHPHASRPWKLLKYKNPIKYYFRKLVLGLDKI